MEENKPFNHLLNTAKKNKNDEFYTQLNDIEKELKNYEKQFHNKVIYCNCDDPFESNFFKYFMSNFKRLGIKKVISSCCKNDNAGYYFVYTGTETLNKENIKHINGDFRSLDCIELLKQSDIVVTNPPFSLFREFITQIMNYNKLFLVVGNMNAITYKEVYKHIQNNKIWLGVNYGKRFSGFIIPKDYELYGTETKVDNTKNNIIHINNCLWFTNLNKEKEVDELPLEKVYYGNEHEYPKYDNYDGIHIVKTKNIPKDYDGHMGVPISFLYKFNPNQFEIIKFRKGDDNKDLCVNGKCPYFRIIIKNKKVSTQGQ